MRKLEEQMCRLVRQRKSGRVGKNTEVDATSDGAVVNVYLHGTGIATLVADELFITMGGWPTPTTRSRLNALLQEFIPHMRVIQRDHEQYLVNRTNSTEYPLHADEWKRAGLVLKGDDK